MNNNSRPESTQFELEICDVSHNEACVLFFPPYTLEKRFIEYFEVSYAL